MSSPRHILDKLLTSIVLVCVCLVSLNSSTTCNNKQSCPARNPLMYAGHKKVHGNVLNNITTPCGQRVFILRLPPRLGQKKSNFPFGPGKGKIWIRRGGKCKATETPDSSCPAPDNVCSADTKEPRTCGSAQNITLTIHNVTSTTIAVTWPPFNYTDVSLGPVSGYALEYRENGSATFDRVNKSKSTSHIFSGLKSDTDYEIRLVLTSCGLPMDILTTDTHTVRTACGDIGPVRNLTVTDTDTYGELHVSWNSPMNESETCEVSDYEIEFILIEYRALSYNKPNATRQTQTVNGTKHQTILTGLEDYATYLVSVTPTLGNDKGTTESQTGNTTENKPSQVTDLKVIFSNVSVIQVTWNPPEPPKGLILQYTIYFGPTDGANDTKNETVNVTSESLDKPLPVRYTLTDLLSGVNYSIQIRAQTAVGHGDWSELIAETKFYKPIASTFDTTTTRDLMTSMDVEITTEKKVEDDLVLNIIIICATGTTVMLTVVCCICVFFTKKKQKLKEKEKVQSEENLVNGPSPYMALEDRAGDLTRYMKIGDFQGSEYMMYGTGSEENQLYTGLNAPRKGSSALNVPVDPAYDAAGYAGLTDKSAANDYTKLFSETSGDGNDENGNGSGLADANLKPTGYMGLQNRPPPTDYTKLLSKSDSGDASKKGVNEDWAKQGVYGGVSSFQSKFSNPKDNSIEKSKQDDGDNNGDNQNLKGGDGKSVRYRYERNVIQDDLLQVPYFEHIGSDDGRISYFEPIADDDEDGPDNPYNASAYRKRGTSYETSLQVPTNPFVKRKVNPDSSSEGYGTASDNYERATDDSGQTQLRNTPSQSDDVTHRLSTEYFEPIDSDDDTTEGKEGHYARSTREVYETIPEYLRNSTKNYAKTVNADEDEKRKKSKRQAYEKSLPNTDIPLKGLSGRKSLSSGYEDAASGYGRRQGSSLKLGDNSKYFSIKTGTEPSNPSTEYFEPIADDEGYTEDPEKIKNKLENYEMISEMRKHLRTTEKNSSKVCTNPDVLPSEKKNKTSRIPKIIETSEKIVYESAQTDKPVDEKRGQSGESLEGRVNPTARERWLEARRKASAGYYQKAVETGENTDKTVNYTSRNYIEPIANDEEGEGVYETTQHETTDFAERVTSDPDGNQRQLQTGQNQTVQNNVQNAEHVNDETEPEGAYQAIPAYGSFQDSHVTGSGNLGDIKIKTLPRLLWNGSSSPEITLSDEFQTLPRGQQHPWTIARAKDDDVASGILPYDHSRVKVKKLFGDSKSDYYNGNYIKDQFNKVNFIAAKVPKKATSETFWRIVWDSEIEIVVNLSSGKTHMPPEKEARRTVGRFTLVWSSALENHSEFYIRKLDLKKGSDVRQIKVCHHRFWPETCSLPHPSSLIDFVSTVTSVRRQESVPILVQCSNGIGATGVFIAAYDLLNYLKYGRGRSSVSVRDCVQSLRNDRVDMVQTQGEYLSVYETLISAVLAPERAVTVDRLMRMDLTERQDALEQEFETLTRLDEFTVPRSTTAGAHEMNAGKNRYPAILPLDSYRVVLKSQEKSGIDSYINATFISSTYSKNALIMAQSPLPSTTDDFWRMIFQYECSSIVSLNEMDSTNELTGGYVPKAGQKRYGKILVKCVSNPENASGLLTQRFSLSHSSSKKKLDVNHYQLLSWPREESQMSEFIRIMMKMQPLVKAKRTLVVHCLDGASRCGVFVAMATELSNLKSRGDIDLFQTVYKLKGRCRHVVKNYDDYLLCYRVLKGIVDAREHDYETLPQI